MFSSFSAFLSVPSFGFLGRRKIDLPPVKVHDIETNSEKRARTLKHLIKANHINYSIIFHNDQFHNHMPHILASSYILGANPDQLQKIYDVEGRYMEPWHDSPGEISIDDWRDYLGNRKYQRAYIDFFEDQLSAWGYDWKKMLEHFLYSGKEPLINSMASGLGHCVIHLGYAYELGSATVAVEALGLTTCFYDDLHKFADDPKLTRPSPFKSTSVIELLRKVAADSRFDGLFDEKGARNIQELLRLRKEVVLDYWNAWDLKDPKAQLEESQKAAAALVVATQQRAKKDYDFFLVHCFTTSHAVRVLTPIVPAEAQLSLVRQQWLFMLLVYIAQLRPEMNMDVVHDYPLNGRDWEDADKLALTSKHAQDAHYVKVIRSMKTASETWGDKDEFWKKAAVQFAEGFRGWAGFTEKDEYVVPFSFS